MTARTFSDADQHPDRDWLLQHKQDGTADWLTFHVYSGDRPRPQWPREQAVRLRRLGRLRTIRREAEEAAR